MAYYPTVALYNIFTTQKQPYLDNGQTSFLISLSLPRCGAFRRIFYASSSWPSGNRGGSL